MHQAIREGHKSITRRLDGLKEINQNPNNWIVVPQEQTIGVSKDVFIFHDTKTKGHIDIRPRYKIGDIVYIKEAWAVWSKLDNLKPSKINHKQDVWYALGADLLHISLWVGKLRTPMFMPACFARDFIKILDVKPIRLLPITDEEAIKEGITILGRPELNDLSRGKFTYAYINLWDEINPKYPHSLNPLVWGIEFELLKDYKKENL